MCKIFSALSAKSVIIFLVSSLHLGGLLSSAAANDSLTKPRVSILASDADGITLACQIGEYRIKDVNHDSGTYSVFDLGANGYTANPGYPRLPIIGEMIGIPLEVDLRAEILQADYELVRANRPEPAPSMIAPEPEYDDYLTGKYQNLRDHITYQIQEDPHAYQSNQYYPANFYEIEDLGFIRHQRVGRVTFQPLQYQASSGTYRFYRTIVIRIHFEVNSARAGQYRSTAHQPESQAYENIFQKLLLNPADAAAWRGVKRDSNANRTDSWPTILDGAGAKYKMLIEQEGMYRVTYQDLVDAVVDPAVLAADPNYFAIFNKGEEVASQVIGAGDGTFDPGDAIVFYGEPHHTLYTRQNAYWLFLKDTPGRRMTTVNGDPGQGGTPVFTHRNRWLYRDDFKYISGTGPTDQDHWFGPYLLAPDPASEEYNVGAALSHWQPTGASATISGMMKGASNVVAGNDHHLQVSVNDYWLFDGYWDGMADYAFSFDFDPGILAANTTVKFKNSKDPAVFFSMFYFDWMELSYDDSLVHEPGAALLFSRDTGSNWLYQIKYNPGTNLNIFDVSLNNDVKMVSGALGQRDTYLQFHGSAGRYIVLTDSEFLSPLSIRQGNMNSWTQVTHAYDYIALTPAEFMADFQPLVDFNEHNGIRTAVVNPDDIFDEFNYGIVDPIAIKNLAEHILYHWPAPIPSYFVLVGDGHYDYHNNHQLNRPNHILPYLVQNEWLINNTLMEIETASDNWYVAVTEEGLLPDFIQARMPFNLNPPEVAEVLNPAEQVSVYVDKVISYRQNPPLAGNWNEKVVFVASSPDAGGDFHADSNILAELLPDCIRDRKLYYYGNGTTAFRDSIVNVINQGAPITHFLGHGSAYSIGTINQRFFVTPVSNCSGWNSPVNDVAYLANGPRQTVFMSMNCINGVFQEACDERCFAADMLLGIYQDEVITPGGPVSLFRASADRGAVLCWAPTDLGYNYQHVRLSEDFFISMFQEGVTNFGQATQLAKYHLATLGPDYYHPIEVFIIFGDPAVDLPYPNQKLVFSEDWTMFSLPVELGDMSPAAVMAEVDAWEQILSYEDGLWLGAENGIDPGFWTLDHLDLHHGYWLKRADSPTDSLIVCGPEYESYQYALDAGWNLVGAPFVVHQSVSDVLAPLNGMWEQLRTYSNGNWLGADAAADPSLWTLHTFQPGQGYWLKMSAATPIMSTPDGLFPLAPKTDPQVFDGLSAPDMKKDARPAVQDTPRFGSPPVVPPAFWGRVLINSRPADETTEVSIAVPGQMNPVRCQVHSNGSFPLTFLPPDDPVTPEIEGGTTGDQVLFSVNNEPVSTENPLYWNEGATHSVELRLFHDVLAVEDLAISIMVNNSPLSAFKKSGPMVSIEINPTAGSIYYFELKCDRDSYLADTIRQPVLIDLPALEMGAHVLDIKLMDVNKTTVLFSGSRTFEVTEAIEIFDVFVYPNPFFDETNIFFSTTAATPVSLKIYTVNGTLIRTFELMSAVGQNLVKWDGFDRDHDSIANGTYFLRISSEVDTEVQFTKVVKYR